MSVSYTNWKQIPNIFLIPKSIPVPDVHSKSENGMVLMASGGHLPEPVIVYKIDELSATFLLVMSRVC
jgi:hypothetical protein